MSHPRFQWYSRRAPTAPGAAATPVQSPSGASFVAGARSVSTPSVASPDSAVTLVNPHPTTALPDAPVQETPPATPELPIVRIISRNAAAAFTAANETSSEAGSLAEDDSSSERDSSSEDDSSEGDAAAAVVGLADGKGEEDNRSSDEEDTPAPSLPAARADASSASPLAASILAPSISPAPRRTTHKRRFVQRSPSPEEPDSDNDSVTSTNRRLAYALDRIVTEAAEGGLDTAVDRAFLAVGSLLAPIYDETGPPDNVEHLFRRLSYCSEIVVSRSHFVSFILLTLLPVSL